MVQRTDWIEDFQKNISDLIAKSPAADIERNVKAMMAQTFSRLDLITREEFDVQAQLLERALARITVLEARVQVLETRASTPPAQPDSAPTASRSGATGTGATSPSATSSSATSPSAAGLGTTGSGTSNLGGTT